jgi:hypothetical protein
VHAVIVEVKISDPEATLSALRDELVPRISQSPGFVAGYWTRKGNSGLSMIIFDSEEAANSMKERAPSMLLGGTTLDEINVREVAAHA